MANAIAIIREVLAVSKCNEFAVFHHHHSLTLSTP